MLRPGPTSGGTIRRLAASPSVEGEASAAASASDGGTVARSSSDLATAIASFIRFSGSGGSGRAPRRPVCTYRSGAKRAMASAVAYLAAARDRWSTSKGICPTRFSKAAATSGTRPNPTCPTDPAVTPDGGAAASWPSSSGAAGATCRTMAAPTVGNAVAQGRSAPCSCSFTAASSTSCTSSGSGPDGGRRSILAPTITEEVAIGAGSTGTKTPTRPCNVSGSSAIPAATISTCASDPLGGTCPARRSSSRPGSDIYVVSTVIGTGRLHGLSRDVTRA